MNLDRADKSVSKRFMDTKVSGAHSEFMAMFDRPDLQRRLKRSGGGNVGMDSVSQYPYLLCLKGDIAPYKKDDELTIAGGKWKIIEILDDGLDVMWVSLSVVSDVVPSEGSWR